MCINSFLIKTFSEYIGQDFLGNTYYQKNEKRYVIYKGMHEPSKVPPMWHAWLHHLIKHKPTYEDLSNHKWQISHQPNLTGTKKAHHSARKLVSSDYNNWKPEKR